MGVDHALDFSSFYGRKEVRCFFGYMDNFRGNRFSHGRRCCGEVSVKLFKIIAKSLDTKRNSVREDLYSKYEL